MKIEKLTPEQEALLPHYRDKWLEIGLSTEPLDFEKAKEAACLAYECAGLEPPSQFYRFESPLSAAIGASMLKGTQVKDQVWDQIKDQVRDQIKDQVRAHVRAQIWAQIWDQVWSQAGYEVRDHVWAQVRAHVRAHVRDHVWAQVFGNHDAHWLGFYEFFADIGLTETTLAVRGLMTLAKHCGWWAPYDNCVIFQDRPKTIRFDDDKRLHCEDGPAIEYRDGFSVYAWRGTRIPAEWITDKDALNPEIALTHENLEQRRAASEIIGWHVILDRLNAQTIDKDPDPQIGELLEVDLPDVGREKFLRVQCGTGRTFALPVPPDMTTAIQSNAWTYGLDASDYQPETRT